MVAKSKNQLSLLLINGLQNPSSVVQIRYFEVACKLSLISAEVCEIVKPVMQRVFDQFFEVDDPLTQMAIMDFVGALSEKEWTSIFLAESKFLERLLTKYAKE